MAAFRPGAHLSRGPPASGTVSGRDPGCRPNALFCPLSWTRGPCIQVPSWEPQGPQGGRAEHLSKTDTQTDLSRVSPRGERFQPVTPSHLSQMRALQGGGPGWWMHGGHTLGRGWGASRSLPENLSFCWGLRGDLRRRRGAWGGAGGGAEPLLTLCAPPPTCPCSAASPWHVETTGRCWGSALSPQPPPPSHGAPTGMSRAPALPRSRMDDLGAG